MDQSNLTTKTSRRIAALFCIAYILVQSFQHYVLEVIPQPSGIAEELLQGSMSLHKWRSLLLLFSFFPMIYIFAVVIYYEIRKNTLLYSIALIGFLIFCFLEIGIRSVEYFYFQLQLPMEYINATNEITKSSIVKQFSIFQSVQIALYFPLMLSQTIASAILAFLFSSTPKINYLVKIAFGINAFRLTGRLIAMLFNVNWFDSFSGVLYLPFVIIIFGSVGYWLFNAKDSVQQPQHSL